MGQGNKTKGTKMTGNGGCVSKAVRNDFQATRSERWSGERKEARRVRAEEHARGVDHGRGCVHCDVVHGR